MPTPAVPRHIACASNSEQLFNTALKWLEQDATPRVIVSRNLQLQWANEAAKALLDTGADIALRDGALALDGQYQQKQLADFVETLSSHMRTLAVECPSGGHFLFRGWAFEARRLACLCFVRDAPEFTPHYTDVEKVFGLTHAEHGVLGLILHGSTVADIAQSQNISPGTVRTHIRRIYSKIGVSSRESLLFRLSAFRVL
ncbi:helix-turn-helix transcriptional regulator [Stakelama saccharophila]|uniref:Helix-turn-helix transcriptional regulator n=1 Tax=Stakelama saccharophila TaxID=3075605 RepID=A0ABZ0BBF7_9SPHN|nr:helix-turn-helix transcriptional regulator [Stakelama sp. W311]WNO54688.1 helix-turn-helix transcriptional regulator [Stakelama sp. W311]